MKNLNNSIAVLITCHNRKEKTIKCLEDLNKQLNKYEFLISVFLVDDGSIDGTTEATMMLFPNINIIKGNGNLFWNRGMNLAWKEAAKINPDFYLWLNDDTFLFENSFEQLLNSSFEKNNQAIIVGSTISAINNKITYGGRNKNGKLIKPNGELQICNNFNGNVVLVPKSVFKRNGNLDDVFHHALGDFDYGLRANKIGVESYVVKDFLGVCEGHSVLPKWFDSKKKMFDRLKYYYSSSCGSNPIQLFRFENRHHGFLNATMSLISNHVKVITPKLWRSLKNL